MQEIIDNVKLYTYGYCEYVNNHNIFIKKIPTMYYECSIPDEIFDTENYTLIDKNAHIPSHKQESDAKRVVNNTVHHARYFRVNERDKLFWTFYIFSNGLEMYSEMGMKNLICEKKEKMELIDNVVRKNIEVLKRYKIRITKSIIENLAYGKNISFQTFQVLCILHEITFIIQYKKCYYECIHPNPDITPTPYICTLNEKGDLSILFDKECNIDKFRNENTNISSAIGFTCYYTWKGIKKKIPKSFSEYTAEITALSDLFSIKE